MDRDSPLQAALSVLCTLALRLPPRPSVLRPTALLAIGAFAFATEPMLHAVLPPAIDAIVRLEPMLGCILAGFALSNLLGKRRPFGDALRSAMPPVLAFFFLTTGLAIDLPALGAAWPAACGLFTARKPRRD